MKPTSSQGPTTWKKFSTGSCVTFVQLSECCCSYIRCFWTQQSKRGKKLEKIKFLLKNWLLDLNQLYVFAMRPIRCKHVVRWQHLSQIPLPNTWYFWCVKKAAFYYPGPVDPSAADGASLDQNGTKNYTQRHRSESNQWPLRAEVVVQWSKL